MGKGTKKQFVSERNHCEKCGIELAAAVYGVPNGMEY
jgi:hypothetical protein